MSELTKGLVLFPPGASPGHKRRRLAFVAVYVLVVAALVWPIYPRFAGVFPLILGLPLSFAWVILALAVSFSALLALYLTEETDKVETDRPLGGNEGGQQRPLGGIEGGQQRPLGGIEGGQH